MKITSVDVIQLKPEGVGYMRPIVCRVNTDSGIYGLGEAGLCIVTGAIAGYEMIKDYAKMVIGMNPLYHEEIWEKLFKDSFWGIGNGSVVMAALSALDMAMWDIKGKYYGVPVYELLGGKQRDRLRAYASQIQFGWWPVVSDGRSPLENFRDSCMAAKEQGYTAVKANFLKQKKQGGSFTYLETNGFLSKELLDTAEERIALVRDILGPDADIILENHAMTDATSAVQFAKMAEKYKILFMEEPAVPLNAKVFRKIAAKTDIPLATGEHTYTRWGFLPLFESGAISVAQPDIGNCGGITECKKICDMAAVYDVGIQTHVCSSPISVAAALQLEAAIPNFVIHEHYAVNAMPGFIALCKYDYQPRDGYFEVPDLPGLGQELSDYALSKAVIERVE